MAAREPRTAAMPRMSVVERVKTMDLSTSVASTMRLVPVASPLKPLCMLMTLLTATMMMGTAMKLYSNVPVIVQGPISHDFSKGAFPKMTVECAKV